MAQDQELTCKDCGNQFTFTAGEQDFFAQKGFTPPTRCKDCREKAKRDRRGQQQMHDIICKDCGNKGQVPFQPRDPNSVLCSDCFAKSRGLTPRESVAKTSSDTAADEPAVE